MTEFAEKLPWRDEFDLLENGLADIDAKRHADRLFAEGDLPKTALENPKKMRADLILGLERAALYYWLGQSVGQGITFNRTIKHKSIDSLLLPHHRPESYEDRAFIWVMAVTWEHLGGRVGTATFPGSHEKAGAEMSGPFRRFCSGWLENIDHDHKPPGRKKFRNAIERAEQAGAIGRPHKKRHST